MSSGVFFFKENTNLKELSSFFPRTIIKNCGFLSKQLVFFEVNKGALNKFLRIISINIEKFIKKNFFLWYIRKNENILNIDYNNIRFFFKVNHRNFFYKFNLLIVKLYVDLIINLEQFFLKILRIFLMINKKKC